MAIVKNPKTGKYEIVKSPASFYESPKVKPGQPVYVNIDDVNKSSGTIYTSPSSNQYVEAGTLSKSGITPTKKSSSSSQPQPQPQQPADSQLLQQSFASGIAQQQAENVARANAQRQAMIQSSAIQRGRTISRQETSMNYGVRNAPSTRIYIEPTIETRETGFYKDEKTGRKIPTTETFLIEPPAYGSGGGSVKETSIIGIPTSQGLVFELPGYEPVTIEKELEIKTPSRVDTALSRAGIFSEYKQSKDTIFNIYGNVNTGLKESITEPTIGRINFDKARSNVGESTEFLLGLKYKIDTRASQPGWTDKTYGQGTSFDIYGIKEKNYVTPQIAYGAEFISGASLGFLEDVKDKPAKYVAIYGVSAGVGFGVQAARLGVSNVVGSGAGLIFGKGVVPTVTRYTGTALKVGEVGAGAVIGGMYGYEKYQEIKLAPTYYEKGSIFGVASGESVTAVYGFSGGSKLFDKTRGLYATRGREFIEIKQGEYPAAPASSQLSLFKKNIYPELSAKPGAFHTTSEIFWKGGKITPASGTSELPGLYGSTQISTPFARITGSSSAKLPNTFKDIMKNIFDPKIGSPGVAYLEPKGFRYSSAVRQKNFIEGQKFPFKFTTPSRSGYADVPGIKTEIEAIFRPEAGGYKFDAGKYYTNIKGVRVPIDTFSYDKDVVGNKGFLKLVGGQSSYSGYSKASISTSITYPKLPLYSSSYKPTSSRITPTSSMPTSSSITSSIQDLTSGRGSSGKKGGSSSKGGKSYTPSSSIIPSSVIPSYSKPSPAKPSYSPASRIIRPKSITPSYYPSKTPTRRGYKAKMPKLSSQLSYGRFPVFARRFGKWKNVGYGKTMEQALFKGKQYSTSTLGRSFYVPGVKGTKLTGFRTKKTKDKGIIFIQKTGKGSMSTLGSKGEKREIGMFKGLLGKKRKRRYDELW